MVAISINCRVSEPRLQISGLPILIAKKEKSHQYLEIFLSIEGLLKSSLARAHLDVQFFTNFMLKKTVSDKQFSYLVLAVLYSIVAYRIQFSFVSINMCVKWDTIIYKGLKSKSGLPHDFPNDAIHYFSLYGLKSFEQIQAEGKSAFVVSFTNSFEVICGHLLGVNSGHLSLFMDGSLSGLGTLGMKAGAAVFFENIDLGLGVEIKGHFGVLDNECTDALAGAAVVSGMHFPYMINEYFLKAGGTAVFSNSRHFKVGSGFWVLSKSSLVWHLNFHLAAGFTSVWTAGFQTYFIKALHHRFLIAVCKCLYNRSYSSVLCLFCDNVEVSDHLVEVHASAWEAQSGLSHFFSCVSQLLFTYISDVGVSTALCKSFVFKEWYHESVAVFKDSKIAA
ncbi:hypothetical protein G9A89_001527 [Geosiphon pyriformis]|nr:hypothetical protein G9A89_001527 [Geosiphon pyriformis]